MRTFLFEKVFFSVRKLTYFVNNIFVNDWRCFEGCSGPTGVEA